MLKISYVRRFVTLLRAFGDGVEFWVIKVDRGVAMRGSKGVKYFFEIKDMK